VHKIKIRKKFKDFLKNDRELIVQLELYAGGRFSKIKFLETQIA
jgi:hypothetical protein